MFRHFFLQSIAEEESSPADLHVILDIGEDGGLDKESPITVPRSSSEQLCAFLQFSLLDHLVNWFPIANTCLFARVHIAQDLLHLLLVHLIKGKVIVTNPE